MSEGTWLFGFLVGVVAAGAAAPFAVGKIRHDEVRPCELMALEAQRTGPVIVSKLLRDDPFADFIAATTGLRSFGERQAGLLAADIAREIGKKEGLHVCYLTFYVDIIAPDEFDEAFVQIARKIID